jgi:hypothetical protein
MVSHIAGRIDICGVLLLSTMVSWIVFVKKTVSKSQHWRVETLWRPSFVYPQGHPVCYVALVAGLRRIYRVSQNEEWSCEYRYDSIGQKGKLIRKSKNLAC